MLYRGAASRKTYASQAGFFRSHADMRVINLLKKVMKRASDKTKEGEPDGAGKPPPAQLRGMPTNAWHMSSAEIVEQARITRTLEVVRGHAVMRTNRAIAEDYADRSQGIALTHAERRGIPPGELLPGPGAVEAASLLQLASIKNTVVEAVDEYLASRGSARR